MTDNRMAEWLLKQIDDDLLWAREASRRSENGVVETGVHWQWETSDDQVVIPEPGVAEFVGEEEASGQVDLRSREEFPTRYGVGELPQFAIHQAVEVPSAVGGHIIRHDPASVILVATAHRKIVQRCLRQAPSAPPGMTALLEEILRDLAEGHRERPGYLPEWQSHNN